MNILLIVLVAYLAIGLFFGMYYWVIASRSENSKKNDAAEPETSQEPPEAPQAAADQPAPKGFKAAYNKGYHEGSESIARFLTKTAAGRFLESIIIVLVWPLISPILLPAILRPYIAFFKGVGKGFSEHNSRK